MVVVSSGRGTVGVGVVESEAQVVSCRPGAESKIQWSFFVLRRAKQGQGIRDPNPWASFCVMVAPGYHQIIETLNVLFLISAVGPPQSGLCKQQMIHFVLLILGITWDSQALQESCVFIANA